MTALASVRQKNWLNSDFGQFVRVFGDFLRVGGGLVSLLSVTFVAHLVTDLGPDFPPVLLLVLIASISWLPDC